MTLAMGTPNAHLTMERVLETVAQPPFTEQQLTGTLSSGITCYVEASGTRLLDRADKAMYQAKQVGRNRVVIPVSNAMTHYY